METNKLYSITETMNILSVCRKTVYNLIDSKKLIAVKIGRATRITGESLKALTENYIK